MESLNPLLSIAENWSVLGPIRSDYHYLRSAQGQSNYKTFEKFNPTLLSISFRRSFVMGGSVTNRALISSFH